MAIRWCFTVVAIRSGIFFNGYCFLRLKLLPHAVILVLGYGSSNIHVHLEE